MACDKPTGDCTNVSPCGSGCGCSGSTTPEPVLPKCQDVSLAAGTFTHATITVNEQGCITAIGNGEPELYTPDECCGSGTDGTGGTVGPRGPKGDPGAAATIAVEQVIGTGAAWTVENTGTTTAAIFKFTAPAPTTGGTTTSGYTGEVGGFTIEAGLVKEAPSSLVQSIEAKKAGAQADLFSFTAVPDLANLNEYDITLNLDAFYNSIDVKFTGLHNDQATLIDNLTGTVANLVNTLTSLQGTLGTQQNTIAELTNEVGDLRVELDTLREEFDTYVAANP
jgi:flagellin-like hook-associated protein FlgL